MLLFTSQFFGHVNNKIISNRRESKVNHGPGQVLVGISNFKDRYSIMKTLYFIVEHKVVLLIKIKLNPYLTTQP